MSIIIRDPGVDSRSGIQKFIDSAQSIEFQRADTVATNISRSGRLITQTRNTVKPWTFKVKPMEYMLWEYYRDEIEQVFIKDRHTEHVIKLGGNAGSAWLSAYMGDLNRSLFDGRLDGITLDSATGNTFTISIDSEVVETGTVLFKSGDIIQPGGKDSSENWYRYPYVVVDTVTYNGEETLDITVNRGYIHQEGYGTKSTVNGNSVWTFADVDFQNTLVAGNDCVWYVLVTSLPSVVLLPGRIAQFSGEVTLMEVVR